MCNFNGMYSGYHTCYRNTSCPVNMQSQGSSFCPTRRENPATCRQIQFRHSTNCQPKSLKDKLNANAQNNESNEERPKPGQGKANNEGIIVATTGASMKNPSNTSIHTRKCSAALSRNSTPSNRPRISSQTDKPRKSSTPSNSARSSDPKQNKTNVSSASEKEKEKEEGSPSRASVKDTTASTDSHRGVTLDTNPELKQCKEPINEAQSEFRQPENSLLSVKNSQAKPPKKEDAFLLSGTVKDQAQSDGARKCFASASLTIPAPITKEPIKAQQFSSLSAKFSHTKSSDKQISIKSSHVTQIVENAKPLLLLSESFVMESFIKPIKKENKQSQTVRPKQISTEIDFVPAKRSIQQYPFSNKSRDKNDKDNSISSSSKDLKQFLANKSCYRRSYPTEGVRDIGKKNAKSNHYGRCSSICSCYQSTRTLYRARPEAHEKSRSPYKRPSIDPAKDDQKSLVKIKPKAIRRKRYCIRRAPVREEIEKPSGMREGGVSNDNIWFECNMPIRVNIPTSICMQNLFGFSPFLSHMNTMANSLVKASGPMNSPKLCFSLGPSSIPSHLPQIQESQEVKPVRGKGKVNKKRKKFSPSSYPFPCEISTQTSPTSDKTPTLNSLPVSEHAPPDLSSVIFSQCKLLQNCVELITKQLAISEEKRHTDETSNKVCKKNVKSQPKLLCRKADKVMEEKKEEVVCKGHCLSTDEDSCLNHVEKEITDQPSSKFLTCRSNYKSVHQRDTPKKNKQRVSISAHNSGNSFCLANSHRFRDTVPKESFLSGLSDKMLPANQEYLYAVCPNHYKIKEMPETLVPRNSIASTFKKDQFNSISHHTPSESRLSQTIPVDQFHSDAESHRRASCVPSKRTIPALSMAYPTMQENWRTASYSQSNYTRQEPPNHQQFQREQWEENCRKCCLRREPMFYNSPSMIRPEDLRSTKDSTSEWSEPSMGSEQQMFQIEDQRNMVRSPRPSVTNNRVNVIPNKLSKSGEILNENIKTVELTDSRNDRKNSISNWQATKKLRLSETQEFSEPSVTPTPYLASKRKSNELSENKSRASSLRSSQRQGSKKFLQLPLEITSPEELLDRTSMSHPPTSSKNAQNQMLVKPSAENDPKEDFRYFRQYNCLGIQQSKDNAAVAQNNENYQWVNGGEEETQQDSTESRSEGSHSEESSHVNIGYLGPSQDFALCDYADSKKQQLNIKLLKQIINESSIERKIHSDCIQKVDSKGQEIKKNAPNKASAFKDAKVLAKETDKKSVIPTSKSNAPSSINKNKLRQGLRSQSEPPSSKRNKEAYQCINKISKEIGLNPFLTRRTRLDITLPCPPSHGKSKKKAKISQHLRCTPASPSCATKTQIPQTEDNCECNCHCDFDCNIDCAEPTRDTVLEQYKLAGYQRCFPTYPPQRGGTEMLGVSSDSVSSDIFRLDQQENIAQIMDISQSDERSEISREIASDTAMDGSIPRVPVQSQSPCAELNQAKTSHNAEIQGKSLPPTPRSQVVSPRSKTKCKSEVNNGKNMQQLYRDMVTNKKTVMLMHPRRLRSAGSVQSAPTTMVQRVVPNRQQVQRSQRLPTMSQQSSHSTFSSTSSTISRQRSGMARHDLPETTCTCDVDQFLQTVARQPPNIAQSQYPGQIPNVEVLGNQQQQMLKQQQQLWQQQQLIKHQRHIIQQYQRPLSGQPFPAGYPEQNNNNNNNIDYIRECTDCNCWVDPRHIRRSSMGHFQSKQSLSQDYQTYRSVSHQYPVPIKSDQLDTRMQLITPSFYQETMAKYGIERIDSNFQPPHLSIESFGQQFQRPQLQGATTSIRCLTPGHPFVTMGQPQPQLRAYSAPQCPQPMYKHFTNTYTESSTI